MHCSDDMNDKVLAYLEIDALEAKLGRYQRALEAIASGEGDAQVIARQELERTGVSSDAVSPTMLAAYRALHDWLSDAIEDDDTIDLAALADKLEDIARLRDTVTARSHG